MKEVKTKHACLIMAHKNKEQLIRLIKAVSCPEIDVFVHLDKNWKLSKDELDEIRSSKIGVSVIENRIHGRLDDWSLPQMSLNLISSALKSEKEKKVEYKYFILLSGQDYPIKNREYILKFLDEQYPKPLIDICEICSDGSWGSKKYLHVREMNKIDKIYEKHPHGLIRKIKVLPHAIKQKFLEKFVKTPFEKLQGLGLKLSIGSQWWILPRDVVVYADTFATTNKRAMRIYRKTWTPDETFFQTMTVNHKLFELYSNDDAMWEKGDQQCMTYANFVTPTKGFRGHPHDITTEDFERIMAKKQLFARKFNAETDKNVIDMIDKSIKQD